MHILKITILDDCCIKNSSQEKKKKLGISLDSKTKHNHNYNKFLEIALTAKSILRLLCSKNVIT